jgi:hypothetical protein
LLVDHEPSADRQDRRLQQKPQNLRRRAKTTADVAGAPAGQDVAVIELPPVLGDAADHAHGRDRLGIAPAGLQEGIARDRELGGASGFHFSNDGQRDEDNGAGKCGEPDIGVEQKADREIDRHPRQIKKGDRPAPRKKAAYGIQVAHRL